MEGVRRSGGRVGGGGSQLPSPSLGLPPSVSPSLLKPNRRRVRSTFGSTGCRSARMEGGPRGGRANPAGLVSPFTSLGPSWTDGGREGGSRRTVVAAVVATIVRLYSPFIAAWGFSEWKTESKLFSITYGMLAW